MRDRLIKMCKSYEQPQVRYCSFSRYFNVIGYFYSPGHSVQNFSFMPIDKVSNNLKRLLKETTWMHVLGTISPKGMDSKVLF